MQFFFHPNFCLTCSRYWTLLLVIQDFCFGFLMMTMVLADQVLLRSFPESFNKVQRGYD